MSGGPGKGMGPNTGATGDPFQRQAGTQGGSTRAGLLSLLAHAALDCTAEPTIKSSVKGDR